MEVIMNEREEVVKSLRYLYNGLDKMEQLYANKDGVYSHIQQCNNEIQVEEQKIAKANYKATDAAIKKKGSIIGNISIIFTILLSLTIMLIGIIACFVKSSFSPFKTAFIISLIFIISVRIITKKIAIYASKNSATANLNKVIPQAQYNITGYRNQIEMSEKQLPVIEEQIVDTYNDIQPLIDSFPPAYCYPYAVERVIFFIENLRADSLKEALNIYEDEVYKNNMLAEQRKQTMYARISAAANLATANNTARAAEYARQTANNTARTADCAEQTVGYARQMADSAAQSAAYNAQRANSAAAVADYARQIRNALCY